MTGDGDDAASRPVPTYPDAAVRQSVYVDDTRERFEELARRDLMARTEAELEARGESAPDARRDPGKYAPLDAAEHKEILAAGAFLASYYQHPTHIHSALLAGVTWIQIADAANTTEVQARQAYREWADAQYRMHQREGGKFGALDAHEHAAARARADAD